jgi:hypothetical protein
MRTVPVGMPKAACRRPVEVLGRRTVWSGVAPARRAAVSRAVVSASMRLLIVWWSGWVERARAVVVAVRTSREGGP